MIRNYIKIALRTLLRHKGYSITSITGLALGFACCLVVFLYVQHELSYDKYHANHGRIFRLATYGEGGASDGIAKVNGPWGPTAAQSLPEVEGMTRFLIAGQTLLAHDDKRFYETDGFYADSTVFSIFSFNALQGDLAAALTRPASIVLTASMAEKYFGKTDPIGKTIVIDSEREVAVTAVLQDVPSNSHFTFTYLLSMSGYDHPQKDNWIQWNQYYTYLLLKPETSQDEVARKFERLLPDHVSAEVAGQYHPFLQPLADIHLRSHLFREINANSDVSYLYIFSGIGLLILLISSINFINLSTARAVIRAREVGIRKSSGALRSQLISQYLGESVLLCLFSLVIALVILYTVLPYFNEATDKRLVIDASNISLWISALLIAVVVGLAAGGYPAFALAQLRPAEVLKGRSNVFGKGRVRHALVVAQFAISAFLLISVTVIYRQLRFIQQQKLGFNPSELITIPIHDNIFRTKAEAIRSELLSIPEVESVSMSGNQPGGGDWGIPCVPEGVDPEQVPPIRMLAVDHDFINTFGMEIAQGRDFSREVASDSINYIINEEAARPLGWSNPLSETIGMPAVGRPTANVVGVVRDFHFRSLREKIGPVLFFIPPVEWIGLYTIRIKTEQLEEGLKAIEEKWSALDPAHPFTYTFFDESYGNLYRTERQLGRLIGYFTAVAIFIASLGLFSLAAFITEQRTKEIGIRKVLGASLGSITMLLSRELVGLVIVGFLIATPAGYFLMEQWLGAFVYRTDISPTIFVVGGGAITLLSWLTVSYKVVRAGMANPVNSLRAD